MKRRRTKKEWVYACGDYPPPGFPCRVEGCRGEASAFGLCRNCYRVLARFRNMTTDQAREWLNETRRHAGMFLSRAEMFEKWLAAGALGRWTVENRRDE